MTLDLVMQGDVDVALYTACCLAATVRAYDPSSTYIPMRNMESYRYHFSRYFMPLTDVDDLTIYGYVDEP